MTLVATLVAAAAVGLALGLLGGGGSILILPALIYLAHVPAKPAIAMSLFVVGVTSLAGLVTHARAGRVRWRTGALFAAAGMAGAYSGGRAAHYLPVSVLLVGFGLMMAATAVAMLRPQTPRRDAPGQAPATPRGAARAGEQRIALVVVEGAAVGMVTGLVGAGGGFVVVPALVLLGGLAMQAAVGTSLLVIAAQAFAGFAGHLHGADIDWPLTFAVSGVAVATALAGGRLAGRLDAQRLRKIFGGFVAVMAVLVLAEQVPAAAWGALLRSPLGLPLLALAAAAAATLAGGLLLRRRLHADSTRAP